MKKYKKIALIVLGLALLVLSLIVIKNEIYATTTLPKVYFTVSDVNAFENMQKGEEDQTAILTYEDSSGVNFTSYMKIKVQGSSSAVYPKKNYTINLYNDCGYTEKQKVDMDQGWGEASKYCLKANWIDDTTQSRNVVTAKLAAKMQEKYGLFANTPKNGVIDGFPVEIYVNGEFWGLYTWNIPKDEWMWNLDKDNPNHIAMVGDACIDSTYFKKEITSIDTIAEDYWEIEVGEETQETVDKFNRLIRFVKNSTDEEFKNNIDSYLNKDAMLNYLVVQYLTLGYDNVAKNMVLVTYDGQVWYPSLYDLDTTWGTNHRGVLLSDYEWIPDGASGYKSYAPHANDSLLLKKVIRCFPDELAERWFELRKDVFSKESILAEFEAFLGKIPESTFELEEQVWNQKLSEYLAGLSQSTRDQYISTMGTSTIPGHDFEQIKGFINTRLPYVDEVMYNKYTSEPDLLVTYSTEIVTTGTVTVTVQANRSDISFGTNPTTYTFNENGTYTFRATDGIGNEITKTVNVNWIDKTAPTATVNYSTTNPTNQDVIVTITLDEEIKEVNDWAYSQSDKTLTKTFSSNGTENIEVSDMLGNKTQIEIVVNNIDKIAPTANVDYSTTEPTNQDVLARITSNEVLQEDKTEGWAFTTGNKILGKYYETNCSEIVKIYDEAGNETEVEVSVQNIDKTAPEIEVSYSTTEMTNQDVTVTLTSNEQIQEVDGWNLSSDGKTLTKIYTQNGSEKVTIYDLVGNEYEVQVTVNNIDKTESEITVSYSITEITNQDVIVTIASNKEIREVTGWELASDKKSITKTYASNNSETVIIYDLVGNEYEVQVNVNNIDKTAPEIEVSYSTTEMTNQEVQVTLTSNEQIQEVDGWDLSSDGKILTKTYVQNGSETVTIYDLAGNQAQQDAQVNVSNIDTAAPEVEVSYSTTEKTNQDVIVTITSNEQIQEVDGWDLSSDGKILTKTYTQNGSETVTIYDLVGNQTQQDAQVSVNNIDKIAPQIVVSYSTTEITKQDVVVTITSDEELQEVTVEGWELSEDKKVLTKTYTANDSETITVYDIAGNQSEEKQVNVNNIDKIEPVIRINFRKVQESNGYSTIVTITSNEELQEVTEAGWELSEDKLSLTKTFTQNVQETIELKDLAGNVKEVNIDLENIDNASPELDVNYSETNKTNQDVQVAITSNEELQEGTAEGWELSEDNKVLTKTFTENGSETVTVYDLIGNKSEVQVSINNIDRTAPELEVSYNKTEMTNEDVIVTITSNEELQEVTEEGWELSEDKKVLTKTYTANDSETVTVYDIAGNQAEEKQITVNNIDKIVPEIEVSYDKTEMTNQNVVVTITSNEEISEATTEGWELSEDKKTLTKIYNTNDSENVVIYDMAGNQSEEIQVVVNNIDKIAPNVEVNTSKTEMTNEDILVTITADEKIKEIDGWELSEDGLTLTRIYDKNIQEKIEVEDLVGNVTEVDLSLINIDKTKPVIKLDYSDKEPTNGDVVVIIKSEEEMQKINGWELSTDKKALTKSYAENTKETIEVKDLAGNITQIEINITNIDKIIPEAKVQYSSTEKTDKNVTVTITTNEPIQEVDGWKLSEDKMSLTKTYEKNSQEIITIKDLAGNIVEKNISISNIDKDKPSVKVEYSKTSDNYIIVKIISTEELRELAGWELSADKKTLTRIYKVDTNATIEIADSTGNVTLVEIKVDIPSSEDKKDTTEESDKTAGNKTDNSTASGTIPNAGGATGIVIAGIVFSILLGITISKLNKYKGI